MDRLGPGDATGTVRRVPAVTPTDTDDATASGRSRIPVVAVSIVFVAVGTLVQLPRQSGTYMWRTVWAEDGAQFYAAAVARPWHENVLESYAGYAHVVPRTLASIGAQLPADWYSVWVTVTAAFSAAVLALFVYFASAPLLRTRLRRSILALSLLLWPALPFEITGTITNIQWTLPMACLLAVLIPVERPWSIAARLPIVLLGPLSSPLCVLLVPVAAWQATRTLRHGAPRSRLIVPVVALAASATQIGVWLVADKAPSSTDATVGLGDDLARLYGTRVVTELVLGVRATEGLWSHVGYWLVGVLVVLVAVVLGVRFIRSSAAARWVIGGCSLGSVGLFIASMSQRVDIIAAMTPSAGAAYQFPAPRYQLFPAALLVLALLVPADLPASSILDGTPPPRLPLGVELRREPMVLILAIAWFALTVVPSYRLATGRSTGPDWGLGVRAADTVCTVDPSSPVAIPISPVPGWVVVVPCREL